MVSLFKVFPITIPWVPMTNYEVYANLYLYRKHQFHVILYLSFVLDVYELCLRCLIDCRVARLRSVRP